MNTLTLSWLVIFVAGNFHFSGKNSHEVKYIQVISDDSIKLGVNTSTNDYLSPLESDTATPVHGNAATDGSGMTQQSCEAKASISSKHNEWYLEPRAENIVRLFAMDGNGVKWYIRANFNGIAIDLVCEDTVQDIDNVRKHYKNSYMCVYLWIKQFCSNLQSSEGLFISKKELEFKLVPIDTLDL